MNRLRTVTFLAVSSLVPFVATPLTAHAIALNIIDLGTLGSSQSYGRSVNDQGQVVGWLSPSLNGQAYSSFMWDNGTLTSLGVNANAEAINNNGQIAAGGYVVTNGSAQSLGTLGGTTTEAFGINNAGVVVGYSYIDATSFHAFAWNNGVMQDLGTLGGSNSIAFDINSQNEIVGRFDTASGEFRATVWDNGVAQDLGTLGGQNSIGTAINDSGEITGHAQLSNGDFHAFFWDDGTMLDIGTLGGAVSAATGINNRGQIVGASQYNTGDWGTFIWSEQSGLLDLCVITDCTAKGWGQLQAFDISNTGYITGFGFIGDELHAFLVTSVPLPPAFYLFGVGLVAVIWSHRRSQPSTRRPKLVA